MTRLFALVLPAIATLLACTPTYADSAKNTDDFRYQTVIAAGGRVDIRNVNGSITFEKAGGDALLVTAAKSGKKGDFGRVQIVSRLEGNTVVVCALWPGQDPASCQMGRGHHDNVDVRVDFRVQVPGAAAAVLGSTMNGDVKASGIAGDATLHTMNGALDVDAAGAITAETMSGEIRARAAAGKPVKLSTMNGEVSLSLPAAANADVSMSTTNGKLTSDFGPLPAPSLLPMQEARVKLGTGGTAITLRTTNGAVHLKKE